jgi:hypothetical protein
MEWNNVYNIINALNKCPSAGFTVRPQCAVPRVTANPKQSILNAIPKHTWGFSSETVVPSACNQYVTMTGGIIYPMNDYFQRELSFNFYVVCLGPVVAVVVKALCYKPEGHGFETR